MRYSAMRAPPGAFTAFWIALVFAANKRSLRVSLAMPASLIWPIFGLKSWDFKGRLRDQLGLTDMNKSSKNMR